MILKRVYNGQIQFKQRMRNCSFYLRSSQNPSSGDEIKKMIGSGSLQEKVKGIKTLIKCIVSDETFPPMIMHVITTVTPVVHQSPALRKVMLLYWEIIQKNKSPTDKSLKDQMFLACNSLRGDLLSHNQFLRGRSLRLVSRIMHRGVIEPLSSAIIANLDHRSAYVRRNAVVCLYQVYINFGSDIIGDIDEEIEKLLVTETDLSTKRNAFLLLHRTNPSKAMKFLQSQIYNQTVDEIGDILQLAILKVFRGTCKEDTTQKPKLLKMIKDFSINASQSVSLQCAMVSNSITNSVSTIKNSVSAYVGILVKTNEINVKKIILDKLCSICRNSSYLQDDLVEDLVKVLNTPSFQIKIKLIQIINTGITLKTSLIVLKQLEGQFKNVDNEHPQYYEQLVNTVEVIGLKFEGSHKQIVPFITEKIFKIENLTPNACASIINILKHILVESSSENAQKIHLAIMSKFHTVRSLQLSRTLLNLIGSCVEQQNIVIQSINQLASSIGSLPISYDQNTNNPNKEEDNKPQPKRFKTIILADGSYSRQEIIEGTQSNQVDQQTHYFRNMLASDSIMGGTFARNIAKLLYRIRKSNMFNKYACVGLMILCSLLRHYQNNIWSVDQACIDQITTIIRKITSPTSFIESEDADLTQNSQVQVRCLDFGRTSDAIEKNPEDLLVFRQLKKGNQQLGDIEFDDQQINEIVDFVSQKKDYITKLKSMVQLTGYFDPLYAQAFININKYDIFFEIMMVNNSKMNLMNIQIEFSSSSEVLVLQKAQSVNLRPQEMVKLRSQIRFNGGDFGMVYGYINYDNQAGLEQPYLITQQIKIDYMEFIQGAETTQKEFKKNWQKATFQVKEETHIKEDNITFKKIISQYEENLHAFAVEKYTHSEEEYFLNVHLYGQSKLGEDFLINLALFKGDGVSITTTIRSKDKAVRDILHRQFFKIKFND